ncbi:MAG: hypothetical protein JW902_08460, partial [Syntrophaceae bacterium]|nr:hypothetical protein [Syntrophaceae bacterium]
MRKIVTEKPFPANSSLGMLLNRQQAGFDTTLSGLYGSARSFLISALFAQLATPLVAVLATEKEAREFYRDCLVFSGEASVMHYPAWDTVTADFFTVQKEIELARLKVLSSLASERRCLVITSLPALVQKIIPKGLFLEYIRTLSLGDTLDRDEMVRHLLQGGYVKQTLVEGKGEFSARGHILDIYPPDAPGPYRVELIGDEVESIRLFDPANQRSNREVLEFQVIPARELVLTDRHSQQAIRNIRSRANELELPRQVKDHLTDAIDNNLLSSVNPMYLSLFYRPGSTASNVDGELMFHADNFFDYCSEGELFFTDDPSALGRSLEDLGNTVSRVLIQARHENKFFLDAECFLLSQEELQYSMAAFRLIRYEELHFHTPTSGPDFPVDPSVVHCRTESTALIKTEVTAPEGILSPLVDMIRQDLAAGHLVIFMCPGREDVQRMTHLLQGYGLQPDAHDPEWSFIYKVLNHGNGGRLVLREGKVISGFRFAEMKLTVLAEEDIFGRKQTRRLARPAREGYFLKSFSELSEGDFIVHKDHGIGVYRGLQKMAVADIENDYLLIEYAEKDRLYIPVDRLDQIQRYIGP